MTDKQFVENLYLLNLALLFTHEIDSAFWHEWDLFGLPGGIQLFLLLNLIMVFVGLVGFRQVVRDVRSGYIFSLVVAAAGIFAFCIHGLFLLTGHSEFNLPFSLILIAALLPVSLMQGYYTLRVLRSPATSLDISRHALQ